MFLVSSYLIIRAVEPILALNVVRLCLLRLESRICQGNLMLVVELMRQRSRTEICMELILLLTVEVHLELVRLLRRTEFRSTVSWRKVIIVAGDVAY